VAFVIAPRLVAFFIPNDPAVIAQGAVFIRVMCLAWGATGVQFSIVAAFRASGNMLMAMVIALVSQGVVQFPLAFILSRQTALGADGLWWSFPATNLVVAAVSVLWFAKGGWKQRRLAGVAEARVVEEVVEEGLRERF
jgi:Na+-driven multidrug efflux pump